MVKHRGQPSDRQEFRAEAHCRHRSTLARITERKTSVVMIHLVFAADQNPLLEAVWQDSLTRSAHLQYADTAMNRRLRTEHDIVNIITECDYNLRPPTRKSTGGVAVNPRASRAKWVKASSLIPALLAVTALGDVWAGYSG